MKKIMVVAALAVVMSAPAFAGGWPPGSKFAIPECAEKPVKGGYRCYMNDESVPFKVIIKGTKVDFGWFKKVNNLPASVTPDTLAPKMTFYAIGYL